MTQVTQPFDRVLKMIRKEIDDPQANPAVVDELARIARQTLERAAESKDTGNQTMNQLEAYGFGVFFNGGLVRQGYLDKKKYHGSHRNAKGRWVDSAEPDPKRHKRGRIEALRAIQGHRSDYNGYELYLVNAIWYSSAHEAWGLKIITQELLSAASAIASEFGVDVYVSEIDNFGWN